MAQVNNYIVEDGDGLSVLNALTALAQAIRDDNAGPTAPPNPVPGMRWRDTSVSPPVLRVRNAGNSAWDTFLNMLGVSTTPAQLNGVQQIAGRNLIINGAGRINQRNYGSGVATAAANQFTLDRWFVLTGGQSLSFTGNASRRVMTAPAGGVRQVIEGANIVGGTYVLNWSGTATATVNGVSRTKGTAFTLTANANAAVTFANGTFTDVQLELGSVPTPFEANDFGDDLDMCQRYYALLGSSARFAAQVGGESLVVPIRFPRPMRAVPAIAPLVVQDSVNSTRVLVADSEIGGRHQISAGVAGDSRDLNLIISVDAELTS